MGDANVNTQISQGMTTLGTRIAPSVLGQKVPYQHRLTPTSPLLSGMVGEAVVAINDVGSTLNAGQHIRWKDGYYGTRIGAAAGAGEPSDGVIDHMISSAGVLDDYACLVVVSGMVRMISDGASTLAIHDVLKTAASGKVTKDSATPSSNGKCAKATETVTNVDGTVFWGNFVGP